MEYFIKASAVLGIFYICYKFFLQKETFFNANRWFLLIGLLTASLLPLLVIPIYVEYTPLFISNNLLSANQINNISDNNPLSFFQILTYIYVIGLFFFFGKLFMEFTSLFALIKNNEHKKEAGFNFIETDNNVPPFSFFNWIVYNPKQFQEQELTHIINHEKVHAKQNHSIDVMLAQLSCVVFWFNPFCWLYKRELQQNLEFIADYKAQNISNCEKSYQNLLLKTSIPNHQSIITNNFYNSLIKKRIVMLHKSKSNKLNAWKFGIILPLLGLFLMSFSTKNVYVNSPSTNYSQGVTTKTEMVVITKNSTEADLENVKTQLLKQGLTIKFKGIKRNASGEIIAIKIDVKSNESSANYNINGDVAITPISISFNKNGKQIAIGNASLKSSNKMVFISEEGEVQNIKSNINDKNIFVIKTENGVEKEIEVDTKNDEKVMFISDDVQVKTIKEGNKTIEIITLSDDGELVELEDDGNLTSKTVWVTKNSSDDNWTTNSNGDNKKAYKVKVISSDSDDLHFTTRTSNTNQKVKVVEMTEKDDVFILSDSETPLFILDGKEITKEEMKNISPDIIANVNVFKGEKAIEKYGEKAKGGVVIITTKK